MMSGIATLLQEKPLSLQLNMISFQSQFGAILILKLALNLSFLKTFWKGNYVNDLTRQIPRIMDFEEKCSIHTFSCNTKMFYKKFCHIVVQSKIICSNIVKSKLLGAGSHKNIRWVSLYLIIYIYIYFFLLFTKFSKQHKVSHKHFIQISHSYKCNIKQPKATTFCKSTSLVVAIQYLK